MAGVDNTAAGSSSHRDHHHHHHHHHHRHHHHQPQSIPIADQPSTGSSASSKTPTKSKGKGFIATLRRKLVSRTLGRNSIDDEEEDEGIRTAHRSQGSSAAHAATICRSWRAPRAQRIELRPAYSDECLSCCTGSCCRRSHATPPDQAPDHELTRLSLSRTATMGRGEGGRGEGAGRRTVGGGSRGIVICKHCQGKTDRSPSDIEPDSSSPHDDENKVCSMHLPAGAVTTYVPTSAYGHASAPVPITSQVVIASCEVSPGQITPTLDSDQSQHICDILDDTIVPVCEALALPPTQPYYDQVKDGASGSSTLPKGWSLSRELFRLSKYGWYWGPISRVEAEEKLANQPDGSFLVRDSSDERYLLSLSFRSFSRTLHTRIEHSNGVFSFYAQPESEGYSSIVDLIEHSMTDSESGVFCYSRARIPGSPSFPVRLAKPVSRFAQVRTLQYLCRFVIRQYTRVDHIQQLPLPASILGWLEENQY